MKKILLIILGLILLGIFVLVIMYYNSPAHKAFKYQKDAIKQQEKFINQQKAIAENLENIQDESKIFKNISILTKDPITDKILEKSLSDELTSPFFIKGEANFYWFPEGWFKIILVDEFGNEITSAPVRALSSLIPDKDRFMPFGGEISFNTNKTNGVLIFKKHEYSKLKLGDYKIPIKLK